MLHLESPPRPSVSGEKVVTEDQLPKEIRFVAGVDAAYVGGMAFGAVAVLDHQSLEVLETQTAVRQVKFPYVSSLLSFREFPVVAACIGKLKRKPDVVLVDGHGRVHPYRLGLASHLGVVLGLPTVGVAKNRLVGEVKQLGEETFLVFEGEKIGAAVATCAGVHPVYVSVGHRVSLETAVKIVKNCSRRYRIPVPIRVAHKIASEEHKAKMAAATNTEAGERRVERETERYS
ncbi:MAG: endonuclease V [Candidatus Bathyarchaeota archaeon]|nr:endonuclease V [Candidatus Bathyarchaeota archaeon]